MADSARTTSTTTLLVSPHAWILLFMDIDVTNLLDYLELGLILTMQSWNSQMKAMHFLFLLLLQKAGCISLSVKHDNKRYYTE